MVSAGNNPDNIKRRMKKMEMQVKHVVEFSPETLAVLSGFVSAVNGRVEAQSEGVKTNTSGQKNEPIPADTEPVKKPRKPRSKKVEPEKAAEPEEAAAEPETEEAPEIDPYTTDQVTQIAFKSFHKLSNDPEAPIGAEALTKKVRELVLGKEKAEDPECHDTATIPSLTAPGRIAFVEYCRSDEVGCADVVEAVLADA